MNTEALEGSEGAVPAHAMKGVRGGDNMSMPSWFPVLQPPPPQHGPTIVSTKRRPVLKDESRYDLFVKAISGSIAQAEPHLSQTQRMKRVGQVWKQLSVEERLKIISEHKAKMEAMGIKDKALVDAGPMVQVRGLKRRAKERYTSAPLRPCARGQQKWRRCTRNILQTQAVCVRAGCACT